jgi:hypothetical protein
VLRAADKGGGIESSPLLRGPAIYAGRRELGHDFRPPEASVERIVIGSPLWVEQT